MIKAETLHLRGSSFDHEYGIGEPEFFFFFFYSEGILHRLLAVASEAILFVRSLIVTQWPCGFSKVGERHLLRRGECVYRHAQYSNGPGDDDSIGHLDGKEEEELGCKAFAKKITYAQRELANCSRLAAAVGT